MKDNAGQPGYGPDTHELAKKALEDIMKSGERLSPLDPKTVQAFDIATQEVMSSVEDVKKAITTETINAMRTDLNKENLAAEEQSKAASSKIASEKKKIG